MRYELIRFEDNFIKPFEYPKLFENVGNLAAVAGVTGVSFLLLEKYLFLTETPLLDPIIVISLGGLVGISQLAEFLYWSLNDPISGPLECCQFPP
jgi:hypothetical protein